MTDETVFETTINGKTVNCKLIQENLLVERACDTEYHVAYTQLMSKGILPRATLEKKMRQMDIWTKDDEDALTKVQAILADLYVKLESADTHEEGLAIAQEMGSLRADCLNLIEAKAAVLSNSCEQLADNIRRDAYIAYGTVFADTNKRVFVDYHDLLVRSSEPVVEAAREQLLILATKSFQESLQNLPEVNYVQIVEAKITAGALELADEVGEDVAEEETPKKKVAKKVVKRKATRKKKTAKKTE